MKTKLFLRLAFIFVFTSFPSSSKEARNIHRTIQEEIKRHPKLEIQDLYKFAYQAALGNEHFMTDSAEAKKYLDEELATIQPDQTIPVIQYLTSDSILVRVDLHAFKSLKKNSATLFEFMLRTSQEIKPSLDILRLYLQDIENQAFDKLIPFDGKAVHAYFKQMEGQNYPAVHHSKIYEDEYKPAYRVISGRLVKSLQ